MFNFEELDNKTRQLMLEEFDAEETQQPYRSPRLSALGLRAFADEMRRAIRDGNEVSLHASLSNPAYWIPKETYFRNGTPHLRSVNPDKAAEFLAYTEFNTWYVRGFAKRLLAEGVVNCEVYRAAPSGDPRPECLQHEGNVFSVEQVYAGHRARYWPVPGNPSAFSIPAGPNCHHSIRRVKSHEKADVG